MTIIFRPIGDGFVAKVTGVDLRNDLIREEVSQIEAGIDKYAVLVFPDQDINDVQQRDFSRNFGVLERPGNNSSLKKESDNRLKHPEMADVGNLSKGDSPYSREDKNRLFNLGNRLWHSDSSFKKIPAKYSLLSARTEWGEGGTRSLQT